MPKPKLYDKRETLRLTEEMDRAIEGWRPLVGLRRGEAVRRLIAIGLVDVLPDSPTEGARTPEQKRDDFYRANMAKGKK